MYEAKFKGGQIDKESLEKFLLELRLVRPPHISTDTENTNKDIEQEKEYSYQSKSSTSKI